MKFDIITIFPKILDSYFKESILKRAIKSGLIEIKTHNLRDFTSDKHHKVDDTPYGGGPGMVFKAEPIIKAVDRIKQQAASGKKIKLRVILFSLRGERFTQETAHRLSKCNQLIFICGRYEGVDERVAKYVADEEISIGNFILSGGELPAAIVVESVARLIPGVLGKKESLEELKGSYSVYTRPEIVKVGGKNRRVPKIMLSGNHKKIEEWRDKHN